MVKEVISTTKAPAAIGPYSQGIRCGNLLFVSGQTPLNPETGKIAEGDIQAQARQCLENVKAILEAAGTNLDNVLKTTVFIKDMNNFSKINEIYAQYFTKNQPARSCIEAARLPLDVQVEIEVIAYIE
ncbi:RidA family protein [Lutispora thermophila]|uniref:2-iminobutanoate/2-iminopropanoate deaminase n=1 Tax=Lutispora thermophila DSM 19022 TaxID=1122184 RepID=A0A1M6DAT8_9FIRM|nr:RidA family protein [Lutispora thermophila]SHI70250.1 2-iminobutanoate/2-iminopropanoate deaminase [Lutispora thermophila DSM 19022]